MSKKKTVLVTGASGFIGKELTSQLLARNYRVVGIGHKENSLKFKGDFTFIKADLRKESSQKYFSGADYCIHLAAQIGGVNYMESYPATILNDNNKILANTFEACVKHKIKRVIYASSSMVYQKATSYPSTEDQVPNTPPPSNIYGFSKLVGEYYCRAYQKEFGLPYSVIRIFNAYGKNEYLGERGHVLPDLVLKILSGQYPLELLGRPQATRPFVHVSDVAGAFVTVLESQKSANEDYNVGNDNEVTILNLAKLLWKLCGRREPFKAVWTGQVTDTAVRRGVDPTKLKKLGWRPKIPLEKGAKEVVEWLKQVKNTD